MMQLNSITERILGFFIEKVPPLVSFLLLRFMHLCISDLERVISEVPGAVAVLSCLEVFSSGSQVSPHGWEELFRLFYFDLSVTTATRALRG